MDPTNNNKQYPAQMAKTQIKGGPELAALTAKQSTGRSVYAGLASGPVVEPMVVRLVGYFWSLVLVVVSEVGVVASVTETYALVSCVLITVVWFFCRVWELKGVGPAGVEFHLQSYALLVPASGLVSWLVCRLCVGGGLYKSPGTLVWRRSLLVPGLWVAVAGLSRLLPLAGVWVVVFCAWCCQLSLEVVRGMTVGRPWTVWLLWCLADVTVACLGVYLPAGCWYFMTALLAWYVVPVPTAHCGRWWLAFVRDLLIEGDEGCGCVFSCDMTRALASAEEDEFTYDAGSDDDDEDNGYFGLPFDLLSAKRCELPGDVMTTYRGQEYYPAEGDYDYKRLTGSGEVRIEGRRLGMINRSYRDAVRCDELSWFPADRYVPSGTYRAFNDYQVGDFTVVSRFMGLPFGDSWAASICWVIWHTAVLGESATAEVRRLAMVGDGLLKLAVVVHGFEVGASVGDQSAREQQLVTNGALAAVAKGRRGLLEESSARVFDSSDKGLATRMEACFGLWYLTQGVNEWCPRVWMWLIQHVDDGLWRVGDGQWAEEVVSE